MQGKEWLIKIRQNPHLFGHFLGYKDLLPIHSTWIKKAFVENKRKYVIQACRNTFKTTDIVVVGVIWYLLFNPGTTILIIRKALDVAASAVATIATHFKSEKIKALYGFIGIKDFHLTKDTRESIVISTKDSITNEGSVDALGIGGPITGTHYDIIIGDDVVTLKDRASKAERERTKDFVRELSNVIKEKGKLIFPGTPWHKDDAFSILPEADKYPLGHPGLPVWSKEHIEELRQSMTPSLFAVNYLLKHIGEDGKVFNDVKYAEWQGMTQVKALLDPAYSGKNTTSLTLGGYNFENKYVQTGFAWRKDITECYAQIVNILKDRNCGSLYVETNADKGLSARDIQAMYPAVVKYNERENKHNKIVGYLKKNWLNIYVANDCQEDYLSQIIDYEEGQEPDDAPDSAAALIREGRYFVTSNLVAPVAEEVLDEWAS